MIRIEPFVLDRKMTGVKKLVLVTPALTLTSGQTGERGLAHVWNVGKVSVIAQMVGFVREVTREKDFRDLAMIHIHTSRRRFLLRRNHTNVSDAENSSAVDLHLMFILKSTPGRDHMFVRRVGAPSARPPTFRTIRDSTPGRSHSNVTRAARASVGIHIFGPIREYTQVRNRTNARSAGRASFVAQIFTFIRESTPEKSPISVWTAGRSLVALRVSRPIRAYTPERNPMFVLCAGKATP